MYESLDVEYAAIRTSAALIDVSPLYKYRVSGADALRLIDRVITRDASLLRPGRVIYTPWCDEAGRVVDDGTLARLDDGSVRWTAADPQLRWLEMNAAGLEVAIDDISEATAAVALQGPLALAVLESATGHSWADLRYYRRRAGRIAGIAVDVTRTGYPETSATRSGRRPPMRSRSGMRCRRREGRTLSDPPGWPHSISPGSKPG